MLGGNGINKVFPSLDIFPHRGLIHAFYRTNSLKIETTEGLGSKITMIKKFTNEGILKGKIEDIYYHYSEDGKLNSASFKLLLNEAFKKKNSLENIVVNVSNEKLAKYCYNHLKKGKQVKVRGMIKDRGTKLDYRFKLSGERSIYYRVEANEISLVNPDRLNTRSWR